MMKAVLIVLVVVSLLRPGHAEEIWHTWTDTQVAFTEEVAE